jgi:biopolymer transport protein ExbD
MAADCSGGDEGSGLFAHINVTPLVDITLVLLIVFMVAAPLIVASPSIKVALPKASTADDTPASTLALTLQREPRAANGCALFVNGKKTDETAVRPLVAGLVAHNPALQAIIAADRGIPYGDVMRIVDTIKGMGVSRFALNTESGP